MKEVIKRLFEDQGIRLLMVGIMGDPTYHIDNKSNLSKANKAHLKDLFEIFDIKFLSFADGLYLSDYRKKLPSHGYRIITMSYENSRNQALIMLNIDKEIAQIQHDIMAIFGFKLEPLHRFNVPGYYI